MNPLLYEEIVKNALIEDIGLQDLTTDTIFEPSHQSVAQLSAKAEGTIAGLDTAAAAFRLLDSGIEFHSEMSDGEIAVPGQVIATVKGLTRTILSAERTALNFLQHMSGIATSTRRAVEMIKDYDCRIADTRKTIPGLRSLEKYAVRIGGGYNHRLGLFDAVLIKDNHIAAAGGIQNAVNLIRAKIGHTVKIEVETESLDDVRSALKSKADIIMLDNMSLELMSEAVRIIDKQAVSEASGGITLDILPQVAATGVDIISVGSITHSAKALDISLNIID